MFSHKIWESIRNKWGAIIATSDDCEGGIPLAQLMISKAQGASNEKPIVNGNKRRGEFLLGATGRARLER